MNRYIVAILLQSTLCSAAMPNIPNRFLPATTKEVMTKVAAAEEETCARLKPDPSKPPREKPEDPKAELMKVSNRFTDTEDWFLQLLSAATEGSETRQKLIAEMQTTGPKIIGAIMLILFLVFFVLGCWHWWICFRCCRCCSIGPSSTKRMACFLTFLLLTSLMLVASLAVGFAGYLQMVRSLDETLCSGVKAAGATFQTMDNATMGMTIMATNFESFGNPSIPGVGAQINAILDNSGELDVANAQLMSVLKAYEDSLLNYDAMVMTKKLECLSCAPAAGVINTFRTAYGTSSAVALKAARTQVKTSIAGASSGNGGAITAGAESIGSLTESLESMGVIADVAKDRDLFVLLFSAGVGGAFALALLVLLFILLASICCCRNRAPDRIIAKHRTVRRCASCGCWLAFFLGMLIFLLAMIFEIILFVFSGVCVALDEIDGAKLVELMNAGKTPDPSAAAQNQQIANIFDTCFGDNGDGLLFNAMTELQCPSNNTNCTDSQKIPRTFRQIFVDDTVVMVTSAFDSIPLNNTVTVASDPSSVALIAKAGEDLRQETSPTQAFWEDPRFAMVTAFADSAAATAANPHLTALMTPAVRLSLHCVASTDSAKALVYKELPWFLGQLNSMTRLKISSSVTTDASVSVSTTCTTGDPTTIGTATCNLFSATFNTQDDRILAKALATACDTKAATAQSSISGYATFQSHIATIQAMTATNAATAAETTAIQQLFGQATATGQMQCDPCKAGNAVLNEIKTLWGQVTADEIYNCPLWEKTDGSSCDPKGTVDCNRTTEPYFKMGANVSCDMNTNVPYVADFGTRISKSMIRVDAATAALGPTIQTQLFAVVKEAFIDPLVQMADAADCGPFGDQVNNVLDTICTELIVGFNKVDIAYLFLGSSCVLMVICGWLMWLFGVKQGLQKENDTACGRE